LDGDEEQPPVFSQTALPPGEGVRARRSGRHRQRLDRIELVGDLGSKIDRAGRTTEYEYDEAGRVKRILQSPSALTDFEATFRYDILGNLVEADNGTARIVYLRDGWGRVTREDLLIDGDNCSTSYGYDKVGNVQYIVYPDATNVSYAYDAFDHDIGRVIAASRAPGPSSRSSRSAPRNAAIPPTVVMARGLWTQYKSDAGIAWPGRAPPRGESPLSTPASSPPDVPPRALPRPPPG